VFETVFKSYVSLAKDGHKYEKCVCKRDVCVRDSESEMCVCVCERDRDVFVCVSERERCVFVCVRE